MLELFSSLWLRVVWKFIDVSEAHTATIFRDQNMLNNQEESISDSEYGAFTLQNYKALYPRRA
jgi:hypothetical protein